MSLTAAGHRKTIIVVGGVAAGAGAAAKARREDESAEIIVFERGEHVSFANCGLPYFIGDEIKRRGALLLHTPASLKSRFNLDVLTRHEVTEIRPEAHQVVARDLRTGAEVTKTYDRLILATGARPVVPPLEGISSRNVKLLRTVPEAEELKEMVGGGARRAVVVGAGFIGLEAAENLARRGVAVTVIEKAAQVLPPFDPEMVVPVEASLQAMGVELVIGRGIAGFETEGDLAVGVRLDDGGTIAAGFFVLSIGVRPDVELAKKAGVAIGPSGGIAVNERMETSVPGIYAAGDAVEVRHLVSGRPAWIPLAGPANKQGRVAGANAAGASLTFKGAYGTSIVRVGKVTAAKTGLGEAECLRAGFDYTVTYNHHGDHAGYYPGAEELTIKVISERGTGRILGAQVVGGRGVDKRVDVLATAIYGGLTVEDLEQLDLAYAPPFGAAKDPVIMAGMTSANIFRGQVVAVTPAEVAGLIKAGRPGSPQVVDVRDPREWREGVIPGAIGIPLPELRSRLAELDPARETIVYCRGGQRSYFAYRVLRQSGFRDVRNLTGGFLSWTAFQKSRS
ncbi:MAG: FAD-dependent oxidoreductase [Bacillota bacterium]